MSEETKPDHCLTCQEEGPCSPILYEKLSRRELRSLLFHLLYAAEAFDYDISLQAIIDSFNRGFHMDIPLESNIAQMAERIIAERDQLDELYKPLLTNWRFDRLGTATKLILRYAIWELNNSDIDPRIVINEAIELSKCFGETDSYRFINGILDKFAKAKIESGNSS